jgi:TRAP-type uncharacterized transport system fused permease subunit
MAMLALSAFAAALEGYALRKLGMGGRLLLLVAALSAFHPSLAVGAAGCLVGLAYVLWDLRTWRGVHAT